MSPSCGPHPVPSTRPPNWSTGPIASVCLRRLLSQSKHTQGDVPPLASEGPQAGLLPPPRNEWFWYPQSRDSRPRPEAVWESRHEALAVEVHSHSGLAPARSEEHTSELQSLRH